MANILNMNIPPDIIKYAILEIAIPDDMDELQNKYEEKIQRHNLEMLNTHYSSGFDLLFSKEQEIIENFTTTIINLDIKSEMSYFDRTVCDCNKCHEPCGFFIFPRSSMSKTPLIMANHTGIIDSSYRGNLMVAVRKCPDINMSSSVFTLEKYERLFQITHPSLCRIFVVLVKEVELTKTIRDVGCFGSTGRF